MANQTLQLGELLRREGADVTAVPVTVNTDSPGNTVSVTLTDLQENVASGGDTETPSATSITIPVDASKLADTPTPDEGITVTATATDEAGNA